jgi:hypothetical protein
MTGKQDWILIFEGTPPGGAGLPGIDPRTGLPLPPAGADPQNPPVSAEDENLPPPVGPIRGVRSRATGEAFKVFLDQSDYSAWEFRSDLFTRFRSAPSENGIPRVSALTLGRPFRYSNAGTGQGPGQFPAPGGPGGSGKPAPGPAKPTLRSQPPPQSPDSGDKE